MVKLKVNENKVTRQKTITIKNTVADIVGCKGGDVFDAEVKKGKIILTLKKED